MKYSWTIAVPYLVSLAAALVQAALTWLGTFHPSTPTALMVVMVAGVLGDWLRAQLKAWQAAHPRPDGGT